MAFLLRVLLLLGLFGAALPASAAESVPARTPRSTATLVSDTDAIAPGQLFHLALRLRLAPGWHTYWRNPGDAGIAPELEFTLPPGGEAGALAWPAPQRQPEGPLTTYGYTGELLLAAPVHAPAGAFAVHASWLVCQEICIPEEATLALDLPAGPPAPSAEAGLFAATAAALPQPSPWPARIAPDGTLTLTAPEITPAAVREAWFAPETSGAVAASPQMVRVRAGQLAVALQPGEAFTAGAPLAGVLELRDATGQARALAVQAEPGGPSATAEPGPWRILALALLGGLVLNLMPCVFPVLAVKAAGLAALAGAGRRRALAEAGAYTAGVVVTFLAIGTLLAVLRAAGTAAGWGFQFQSPAFVAAVAWLLLAVGLNLSGVFAVSGRLAGAGAGLATRGGLAGSFCTGLLAVLVATPCTAPFMGAAIGAALAEESPVLTEATFLAMGLGLAAPYLALAALPGFARALPRPGLWMVRLRQVLAFPMYGAVAWLIWVLSVQTGPTGTAIGAAGCVLVAFAAWAGGTAQQAAGRKARLLAGAVAVVALVAALALLPGLTAALPASARTGAADDGTQAFTAERLAAARAEGRTVFVNMTASWCITCLLNERVALDRPAVRAAFAARQVVYLKGDWTRQDAAITHYLRAFGRDGVPLYVLYRPGQEGQLLPQILTEGTVVSALEGR